MRNLLILFIIICFASGQSYSVSVFGIPAADVEQTIHDSGKIEFTSQNRGIFDLFWPAKNVYDAIYDSNSFALKNWSKTVKQGEFKQKVSGKVDFLGYLVYDDKTMIKIPKNIFFKTSKLSLPDSENRRGDTSNPCAFNATGFI